jgi:hypothetical protein
MLAACACTVATVALGSPIAGARFAGLTGLEHARVRSVAGHGDRGVRSGYGVPPLLGRAHFDALLRSARPNADTLLAPAPISDARRSP